MIDKIIPSEKSRKRLFKTVGTAVIAGVAVREAGKKFVGNVKESETAKLAKPAVAGAVIGSAGVAVKGLTAVAAVGTGVGVGMAVIPAAAIAGSVVAIAGTTVFKAVKKDIDTAKNKDVFAPFFDEEVVI